MNIVIRRVPYAVVEPMKARADNPAADDRRSGTAWIDMRAGHTPIDYMAAYADGNVIGCAGTFQHGSRAYVRGWYVQPDYRSRRVGLRLLQAVTARARLNGAATVECRTVHRTVAEQAGYRHTGKTWKWHGGLHQMVIP